jgi:hypothetical protein
MLAPLILSIGDARSSHTEVWKATIVYNNFMHTRLIMMELRLSLALAARTRAGFCNA